MIQIRLLELLQRTTHCNLLVNQENSLRLELFQSTHHISNRLKLITLENYLTKTSHCLMILKMTNSMETLVKMMKKCQW